MINTGKVYKNLAEAEEVLNCSSISLGEYLLLPYYSEGINDIDILVAIGTKSGVGPGCYSIISTNNVQVVEFTESVPDSSSLKNGQLYIWTDPSDSYNYRVYLQNTDRIIEQVSTDMFVSDKLGTRYYITKSTIKKFSEFITSYDLEEYGATRFLTKEAYDELPSSSKNNQGSTFFICKKV